MRQDTNNGLFEENDEDAEDGGDGEDEGEGNGERDGEGEDEGEGEGDEEFNGPPVNKSGLSLPDPLDPFDERFYPGGEFDVDIYEADPMQELTTGHNNEQNLGM